MSSARLFRSLMDAIPGMATWKTPVSSYSGFISARHDRSWAVAACGSRAETLPRRVVARHIIELANQIQIASIPTNAHLSQRMENLPASRSTCQCNVRTSDDGRTHSACSLPFALFAPLIPFSAFDKKRDPYIL